MLIKDNTDERIKKHVQDLLYWESRLNESRVSVRVLDGRVTLFGTVPSDAVRESVEREISNIPKVQGVKNQLTVRDSSDATNHTESELQEEVKRVLKLNFTIYGEHIDVLVDRGTVTLKGTVGSHRKKQLLQVVTHNIVGVLAVENELRIQR